jgi:alanine racemase
MHNTVNVTSLVTMDCDSAHAELRTRALAKIRAWVEIDLNALANNVRQIHQFLAPQTALMAVVKADAYGHGAVTVAQIALANGASWLGVATIPEGMELRAAGIKAPILVLGATNTAEEIQAIAHWQLQPTLSTPQQALVFSETAHTISPQGILPVHIKLDTGMSRLGINWESAPELVRLVQSRPNLHIASIYSHLATADSPHRELMQQQQARFNAAIAKINLATDHSLHPLLHLANSAATLGDRSCHYDLVRVGLAIYGLYPADHLQPSQNNQNSPLFPILQPVLQVKARITQIKTIPPGTGVSYSQHFIADREMQIAIVGIGYADGVPRLLSNKMQVLIRGQFVRQIGAITMDQLMLDVSAIPNLQVGEIVTLLGQDGTEQISADDWAATLGTISWEILCGFKHRLPRVAISKT